MNQSRNFPVVRNHERIELSTPKPLWRVYFEMLLKKEDRWPMQQARPLPKVSFIQRNVLANRASVELYRELCGHRPGRYLPPIFPHVMATPLQMNLLMSEYFPLNLAGLVHLGQDISWFRKLDINVQYDIECHMEGPFETERGWEFVMHTSLFRRNEKVWYEKLVFLKPDPQKRARPNRNSRAGDASHFVPQEHIQFGEDAGLRYARVSGDWNPIHLHSFLSRRFGFKRPIAHGMYSLARCLALLEARNVGMTGKQLHATFRAPVMLPAYTNFCLNDRQPASIFALTDARKGRILVEGRLEDL